MKLTSLLLCLSICILSGYGQVNSERAYRQFATQEVHERLAKENPEMLDSILSIEDWVYKFIAKNKGTQKFTIPMVFHIITSTGKTPIDESRVFAQIDALNRDFGIKKTTPTHPSDLASGFLDKTAKMDIDFCFPKSKPNGQSTTGINYVNSSLTGWSATDQMKFSSSEGLDAWDTEQYLNVWVVDLNKDLAGYAQMPGGPETTDGIVIDVDYFGMGEKLPESYSEGKTLTHLVGSYLGLYELWDYKGRCRDDRVSDTPIHNSPNFGCNAHNHLSFCAGELTEMLMNFMDNSDDGCMDMFTEGQRQRVMAMLSPGGPRYSLVADGKTQCKSNEALIVEGPPVEQHTNQDINAATIRLYPNPAKNTLQIDFFTPVVISAYECTVLSTLGQIMIRLDLGTDLSGQVQRQIDVSDWPPGLYYFKLDSGQEILSKSFVIQQ